YANKNRYTSEDLKKFNEVSEQLMAYEHSGISWKNMEGAPILTQNNEQSKTAIGSKKLNNWQYLRMDGTDKYNESAELQDKIEHILSGISLDASAKEPTTKPIDYRDLTALDDFDSVNNWEFPRLTEGENPPEKGRTPSESYRGLAIGGHHTESLEDIIGDRWYNKEFEAAKYGAKIKNLLETGDFASLARTYLEKEKATKTSQKEDVFEKAYELITGGKEGLFLLERYLSEYLQDFEQERVSVAKKTKFRRKKSATYNREINKCLETNSFASAARTYMEMEIATGEIQETKVYETASKLICEGKVKTGMRLLNSYFSERQHYIEHGDITHKKKKTASKKHKPGSKQAPYEFWWDDFDRRNEWVDWRKNLQSESESQ
ncbi:MAG: hypothetical protein KKE71_05230, partial [Nanoarchaeota archaeon]|nr:hypothetical protein [Nanoarchaeota archaeon]